MHSSSDSKFPSINPSTITLREKSQVKVRARTIKSFLCNLIYVCPKCGHGFWAWLTYIDCRYVYGYKWNGCKWIKFSMELDKIKSFKFYK